MKIKIWLRVVALPVLFGLSSQAPADVLYSNGSIQYSGGYTINGFGHELEYDSSGNYIGTETIPYVVTDSFTLTSAATVTGIVFGGENYPGDVFTSVDWSISSTPFGGTATTASVVSSFQLDNGSYDYDEDTVSGLDVALAAGTYYLTLGNAVTADSTLAYWAISDGPSTADDSAVTGSIPSEYFEILDTPATTGVAEPTTLALFAAGLAGMAFLRRRRFD